MVTFYQLRARRAAAPLGQDGRRRSAACSVKSARGDAKGPGPHRVPARHPVAAKGGEWKVRTTGQQGSGVLRSMSEANCFIVLEHARGNVQAGEVVQVQLHGRSAHERRSTPPSPASRAPPPTRTSPRSRRRCTSRCACRPGCGPSIASAIRRATCAHMLYVDPEDRFVVTAITWLPGQMSAMHGHHVWCVYGIAEGELDRGAVRRVAVQAQDRDLPRRPARRPRPRPEHDPPRLERAAARRSCPCTSTASPRRASPPASTASSAT